MMAISRQLRASTETLLEVSLPKIMKLDAANKPDTLNFQMKPEWVSSAAYVKAAYNINNLEACVRMVPIPNSGLRCVYYVLSQSQTKYKFISDTLIRQYEALRRGEHPANTAGKYERCVDIMNALHKVEECDDDDPRVRHTQPSHERLYTAYEHYTTYLPTLHIQIDDTFMIRSIPCIAQIVDNEMNPFRLKCNICKGFGHAGSCSHTMTIGHLFNQNRPVERRLAQCDVLRMAAPIDKNKETELTGAAAAKRNKRTKALNKKARVARGQYANEESYKKAMYAKGKAIAKKNAAAKKAAAKKPASKKPASKKPAPKKKKPAASPSSRSPTSSASSPSSASSLSSASSPSSASAPSSSAAPPPAPRPPSTANVTTRQMSSSPAKPHARQTPPSSSASSPPSSAFSPSSSSSLASSPSPNVTTRQRAKSPAPSMRPSERAIFGSQESSDEEDIPLDQRV